MRDLEKGPASERWPEFDRKYDPLVRRFLAVIERVHPSVGGANADDIVQETMIALSRLFPRRAYDRSRGRFRNWLFGVVRMVATKEASREMRRRQAETEGVADAAETAAASAADAALRADAEEIWLAVVDRVFAAGRWSDKAKAVYVRTERGEDVAAVAAAYGMTPNSVYQLRFRASPRVEAELGKLAEACAQASKKTRPPA